MIFFNKNSWIVSVLLSMVTLFIIGCSDKKSTDTDQVSATKYTDAEKKAIAKSIADRDRHCSKFGIIKEPPYVGYRVNVWKYSDRSGGVVGTISYPSTPLVYSEKGSVVQISADNDKIGWVSKVQFQEIKTVCR